jgi:transposase
MESPGEFGMDSTEADGQSARAKRGTNPQLAEEDMASHQKKARTEGRTIIFVDESGVSQRPHRCRTWAPRGQTPVLEYNFNWKSLSAVAGLTLLNFYFRLYPGAIKAPQVVDFLKALVRHVNRPLILVWDRLPAHRSGLVREYIQSLNGQISVEYLPPYAPELNPVEYIWAYWKQNELPNVCSRDLWQLGETARRTLGRMRRRRRLIGAFWQQASLW